MPSRPDTHRPAKAATEYQHAAPRQERYRPSPDKRGYDAVWARVRRMYLRRHPVCSRCRNPASEVHHVETIRNGGARLDASNLEALCKSCHSRETSYGRKDYKNVARF